MSLVRISPNHADDSALLSAVQSPRLFSLIQQVHRLVCASVPLPLLDSFGRQLDVNVAALMSWLAFGS